MYHHRLRNRCLIHYLNFDNYIHNTLHNVYTVMYDVALDVTINSIVIQLVLCYIYMQAAIYDITSYYIFILIL